MSPTPSPPLPDPGRVDFYSEFQPCLPPASQRVAGQGQVIDHLPPAIFSDEALLMPDTDSGLVRAQRAAWDARNLS